jgi:hypothetical protein
LQHDLGDPDGVGIGIAPPRQIAAVRAVPVEERAAERAQIKRREWEH